jgi:hypothetical protein
MVDKELAGGRKLGPEETAMRTNALPPPKGYGGDFKVPKDTGLPNVPHIDFGNNVEIAGVTPNIKRGATDAPRMARLMGRTIPIEPPRPGIPTIPPSAISTEAKAIQAGEAAPFHDLGPPTVPPDAVSPAARSALAGERAPFMPADDVIAGHGPRTTPPGALNYEQSVGPMRERARNAMLPPSSDEALDNSMIMGGPQTPRIPTEYSGRMRPAVTNFERLPNETDKAMKARIAIQDAEDRAALHQAQGKPAGDHLRERPQRSGQSMFDADQLAGNPSPKTPSEYKRSERPTGGYHSEFPEGHPQHGNGKTGAFDYGEFKLSSAPGAKKKTDVKALMKKRADDEE